MEVRVRFFVMQKHVSSFGFRPVHGTSRARAAAAESLFESRRIEFKSSEDGETDMRFDWNSIAARVLSYPGGRGRVPNE